MKAQLLYKLPEVTRGAVVEAGFQLSLFWPHSQAPFASAVSLFSITFVLAINSEI